MASPYRSATKLRRDNALSEITSNATLKANALTNLGLSTATTTANNPIQHVQVALTAAQINALYDTPVQLVAAPGAGHSIAVSKVIFAITRTATAFTSGGAVQVQYANTAHAGGTLATDSTIASTVVTGSAGLSNTIRNGAVISDSSATDNAGLFISNATADFATGTGTAKVDVWYYVS